MVGRIFIGKSQVMLSTSIEFAVDHVVLAAASGLGGKILRGVFDITNSKCNFHRNETKQKEKKIFIEDQKLHLPRSTENDGVHESGIERDK